MLKSFATLSALLCEFDRDDDGADAAADADAVSIDEDMLFLVLCLFLPLFIFFPLEFVFICSTLDLKADFKHSKNGKPKIISSLLWSHVVSGSE